MKIKYTALLFLLITFLISCKTNNKKRVDVTENEAVNKLNKEAMFLARNNFHDNKALQMLDEAIALEPTFYLSYSNKANIYGWRKEYEKALEESKKSLNLNPVNADRCFTTGLLLEKTGHPEEAAEYFKKSIDLYSTQFSKIKNEAEKNALIFKQALPKIFLNDKSYLNDFETLKKDVSYYSIVLGLEKKSRDELMAEFL